jgi:hypothetical protein
MAKHRGAVLAVAGILFFAGMASAHHPSGGVGLGQAGPIRTTSATTLSGGMFSFALQAEFIDLDAFSDSELLGFSGRSKDAHTADSVFHAIMGIGYGITDNLTVSLNIPYEQVNNIRETHSYEPDEIHQPGDSKGGEWKEKQKTRGTWDGNSGGHMIFIPPGTRLVVGKKMSAFLSVGIPVLQDLNGIQDDTNYKGLFGISFSL